MRLSAALAYLLGLTQRAIDSSSFAFCCSAGPPMRAQSSQTDPGARTLLKDLSVHPLAWAFMGAFLSSWLRI